MGVMGILMTGTGVLVGVTGTGTFDGLIVKGGRVGLGEPVATTGPDDGKAVLITCKF